MCFLLLSVNRHVYGFPFFAVFDVSGSPSLDFFCGLRGLNVLKWDEGGSVRREKKTELTHHYITTARSSPKEPSLLPRIHKIDFSGRFVFFKIKIKFVFRNINCNSY